ncbi:MAG TPA: lysylphosphatidylglycerol synthase domain-containing protein [Caulobacteraceae bacterium]|jgi:hypothetical protein
MKLKPAALGFVMIVVGAGLLWLFLRLTGIDAADLSRAVRALRPLPLVVILASTVLSTAAGSEKWRLVEGRLAHAAPTRRYAFGLTAVGAALGMFMPAPVASALVRGGGAHLLTGAGGRRGAFSSAWEQLFDIGVIALAAIPALVALQLGDFRVFLFGAPVLAVLCDRLVGVATRIARRVLPAAAGPLLDPALTLKLYRLSLVKFVALVGMTLGVAAAIQSTIPPLTLAAAIPPVAIAGTLSFVPAGLGVNEWTFVVILGLSGIAAHTVATFAVMNRLLVGGMSIALGLASAALASNPARPGPRSGFASDDAYRDGAASHSLRDPLDRMQASAD